jgi:hypothetical protein
MAKSYLLGKKAKDKVSELEGVITARTEYLYGDDAYQITPKAKDGKISTWWIELERIEIIY